MFYGALLLIHSKLLLEIYTIHKLAYNRNSITCKNYWVEFYASGIRKACAVQSDIVCPCFKGHWRGQVFWRERNFLFTRGCCIINNNFNVVIFFFFIFYYYFFLSGFNFYHPSSPCGRLLEKPGGQVALARVREDNHDEIALIFRPAGYLQGRPGSRPR